EVAPNRRQELRAALSPLLAEGGGQRQGAATERQFPQHERQRKPISRVLCPPRDVHEHYEKEKRQTQQTRCETHLNPCHQAQRGGNKANAYEVRPKQVPRNPLRYKRRDDHRQGQMFSTEGRKWRCVEKRPEQNKLVEPSSLLPIATNKNRDQPDSNDRS